MGAAISDQQVQKMKADKDMYPYGIAKMSGGTDESVVIIMNGKEYTPEQISAEILRQLKNDASVKLGEEVTHAVITVPAYFNEKQITATRKAAKLAGLKVQCLLMEPIAAAISYGVDKKSVNEDKTFLVYDFGDGSFDLTLIVASGGYFAVSGTGGDRWLGGDDIDRLISEYVITEAGKANNVDLHKIIESLPDKKKYAFQGEFKNEIESAKKALGQSESAIISIFDQIEDEDGNPIDIEVTLKREKFDSMIRPLVQRTLDLIDDLLEKTAYPIDTIDNILLVGGSSCIPLVRKMLCDKYGKDKILSSEKPMLAIAEGAAILSHSRRTEVECPYCGKSIPIETSECPYCNGSLEAEQQLLVEDEEIKVGHTTRHKLFIQISDDADNIQYEKIIEENTPLPCEENRVFNINMPNQSIICHKLFSDAESSKEKLGDVYLLVEKGFPLNGRLRITFNLNEDETLKVHASIENVKRPVKVVFGRGTLDSHCCAFLMRRWQDSLYDSIHGNELRSKIQMVIKDIINSDLSPEDSKWLMYEDKIRNIEI
jgi:molecular chaperone DnaK